MKIKLTLIAASVAATIASCTVKPVPATPSVEATIVPTTCTSGVPLSVLGGKYIKGTAARSAFHTSTTVDGAGNVYSAGMYTGTLDFGGATLTGSGSYLTKSDRTGKFIWVIKVPYAFYNELRNDAYSQYYPKVLISGGKVIVKAYKTVDSNPVRTVSTFNPDGVIVSTVEVAGDVYFDSTGNKYIVGTNTSGVYLQKTNAGGTVIWTKDIADKYTAILNLRLAADGSIFMMTRKYTSIVNTTLDHFQKRDASGTVIYDVATPEVGSTKSNQDPFFTTDAAGNAYTNATSENTLQKFDTNGNVAWTKEYPKKQTVTGLSVDNAGNIYAVGNLNGFGLTVNGTTLSRDSYAPTLYIMKLNSSGDGQWGYFVQLPVVGSYNVRIGSNKLSEVFADLPGNLYITGSIAKANGNAVSQGTDFFSIRYKICP